MTAMIGPMGRLRDPGLALPDDIGTVDGLAYTLWLPRNGRPAGGGVVVLHGAGSCKENHHDYARALQATGVAAIVFDQRGHGASADAMGGSVLDDITAIGTRLRERLGDPDAPLAVRGSSLGGYLAILAAAPLHARAVVAICPASAEGLARGLAHGRFPFLVDADEFGAFLAEHPLDRAVAALEAPLLLMHAEGDEVVPVDQSRALAGLTRHPDSRLVVVPGGHHRSIQHDDELQAVSLRFVSRALRRP